MVTRLAAPAELPGAAGSSSTDSPSATLEPKSYLMRGQSLLALTALHAVLSVKDERGSAHRLRRSSVLDGCAAACSSGRAGNAACAVKESDMFSTKGRARALTDNQVRRILQWQRDRKTLLQVARENGVSPGTIYTVIRNGGQYKRSLPLTDVELRRVLKWQRNRKTFHQIARQYGVSTSTIREVIRGNGRYKRSPQSAVSMSSLQTEKRVERAR